MGSHTSSRIAYLAGLCRSVPYHITEAVLADPCEAAVKPRAINGSLLIADLVGYSALCERLGGAGAEGLSRLTQILNALFESFLEEAIFPYRGYVVQFGGDSLTAFFQGEDHALRCAAAALTAERLMHGEGGRLLTGKSRELMLRVGAASGCIRIPVLGDLSQCAAVCAGDVAHRAVRLQVGAPPNAIFVDPALADLLGGDAELVERTDEHAVLRGLHRWPERESVAPLDGRIETAVEEKIRWLELFVPQPLAVRLRSMPSDWQFEPELRCLTVLFMEIAGLDEEESRTSAAQNVTRSLLRTYRKYGGTLTKADLGEHGHRVMVLFGLHRPAENDAERALLAALEATARIRALTLASGSRLEIRTGIHAGKVFFGAIGSAHRHDLTAVGDAVNIAARLAGKAKPFEVITTEAVLELLHGEFETSSRGPVLLKGKTDPIELFSVHSTRGGEARYLSQRRRERFLAGRAVHLEALDRRLRAALAGDGAVMGITGAGGTGKSCLLAPLINQWLGGGGIGLMGRCRWASKSTPLAPILGMFARFLGVSGVANVARVAAAESGHDGRDTDGDADGDTDAGAHAGTGAGVRADAGAGKGADAGAGVRADAVADGRTNATADERAAADVEAFENERRRQIREGLSPYNLTGGAPELMALLQPVQRPDGTTEALIDLADSHVRERVLTSILEFLSRRIDEQPLLYILEDMHLADSLTLELACRLAPLARSRRFLLVATYRPDEVLGRFQRALEEELVLTNLDADDTLALVRHELGASAIDPALASFICQRTGGNPGHVLQTLRFLKERALLPVRDGVAVPPEQGLHLLEELVPRTLEHVALALLDDLGAVERRLLRTAAAIGRRFERPLLERVAADDFEEEQLSAALGALEGGGMIQPLSHETRDYMFRDGITRAVAYGTIPEEERHKIHRRIADVFEQEAKLGAARPDALIAFHRERAGQLTEAASAYARAAEQLARAGLDVETAELVDRWEAVARRLPQDTPRAARQAARLAALRFAACARRGGAKRALQLGRELVRTHFAHLDAATQTLVQVWLGHALIITGNMALARERLHRVFVNSADNRARCDAAILLGKSFVQAYGLQHADRWLAEATDAAGDDAYRLTRIAALRARFMIGCGRFVDGESLYHSAATAALERRHSLLAAQARSGLARAALRQGQIDRAREGLLESLASFRALGARRDEAADLVALTECHIMAGGLEETRRLLEQARILAAETGDESVAAAVQAHWGLLTALTDDPVAGVAACEESLRRAERAEEREVELTALLHLARIAIERGNESEAEALLTRASTLPPTLTEAPLYTAVRRALTAKLEASLPSSSST